MNRWAWALVVVATGVALVVTSAALDPKVHTLLRAVCLDLGLALVAVSAVVLALGGGMVNRGPKPGSWSLREADRILALKDPETRQRALGQLRRARWLGLLPAVIFVVVFFLRGMDFFEFFVCMLFVLLISLDVERRIETILILDLLVFPASNGDESSLGMDNSSGNPAVRRGQMYEEP